MFVCTLGAVTLSGCSGSDNPSTTNQETETIATTTTATETPTPTPTTATTEQPDPETEIEKVTLVTDWKEFGDVMDNQIWSIEPSETPVIGVRFTPVCSGEREVRWRNTTTIRDSNGEAVASNSTENEEFTNQCSQETGTVEWEQALPLYYENEYGTEWPVGEYEAEVRIDDYYGQLTVSETTQFDVISATQSSE